MVKLTRSVALAAMLTLVTSTARAQDPDEVAKQRTQIELLKKENELLKKEIELLKKEAKGSKTGAQSLSELLPEGKVIAGTFRANQGGGSGELTITISERDGNKFKATSILKQKGKDNKELGTSEVDIEGVIEGTRLTWKSVGGANKINATLTLKGDALEGTYKTQAGITGTMGFKLAK